MRCPHCQHELVAESTRCTACGLDLSVFISLRGMRAELAGLRDEAAQVFYRVRGLDERFAKLEEAAVATLRGGVPTKAAASSVPIAPASPPSAAEAVAPPSAAPESAPAAASPEATAAPSAPPPPQASATPPTAAPAASGMGSTEAALGQKWLLIIGVLALVLGIGYFLKYSFDQDWVSPAGRVGIGYLAGLICLGCGEFFRRRKLAVFGLTLIGGGIAVFYFSTWASYHYYHLLGQDVAFGLMVLTTVFAGTLAIIYDTKWLAVVGLLGGFITPLALSTGHNEQVVLMTYLVILNLGILGLSLFKRWLLLDYLGFFFTWLLFAAWYGKYYDDGAFVVTLIYLNLFFLTYALVPFISFFIRPEQPKRRGFAITVPNAFIAMAFAYHAIEAHSGLPMVSFASLGYAAVFMAMAMVLFRRGPTCLKSAVVNLGMAIVFLVVTVPLIFSAHWITVFWAAQAVVLVGIGLYLASPWLFGSGLLLILLGLGKLYCYDYWVPFAGPFSQDPVGRLLTVVIVLACLWGIRHLMASSQGGLRFAKSTFTAGATATFITLLFANLNIETVLYFREFSPRSLFAAISVLWTLYAITLMVLGFIYARSTYRRTAIGLFAATIFKVFVVDMANISTPFRIISFIVLGIILIAASFLYYRFGERLIPKKEEAKQ